MFITNCPTPSPCPCCKTSIYIKFKFILTEINGTLFYYAFYGCEFCSIYVGPLFEKGYYPTIDEHHKAINFWNDHPLME